ncbi:4-hydroxybenzoyl-CoA thioesterase family active site [hydrothermal vent metagenome]|uniref:4-hydroxybenzoyl-CoA thioesterase family active site n=1 Tax=hydrothermal vent metagenome TaxID=652676 RepID=A0A3B1DHV5_9ZZZZ
MNHPHHEIQFRIRYSECDAMGILYHGNYFSYFEMGRTELFRNEGGNYRELEEKGLFFVVSKLTCKFNAPAYYDDLLRLKTTITRMTYARLEHRYELYREDELLTVGTSLLACVDREGNIQRLSDVFADWCEI